MRRIFAIAVLTVSCMTAVDIADMTGTWVLDVQGSKWHEVPEPEGGRLVIQHQEPKLKYEQTLSTEKPAEKEAAFEGAIDGKERNGTIATRLSPFSVLLTTKSEDGTSRHVTFTMTKDGNHLVRRIQANGSQGKLIWTELYDRERH